MNDFVGPVDHGAYNRVEHIDVDVTEFNSKHLIFINSN